MIDRYTGLPIYPTRNLHFWTGMGWDEDEAWRIRSACNGAISMYNARFASGYEETDLRWYEKHPEACMDFRHPMFWYYRGFQIDEAIDKAVTAVALLGNVQAAPEPPDNAVQMLQVLAQTKVIALSVDERQQTAYYEDHETTPEDYDTTPEDSNQFNPDNFPRFGS